MDDPVLRARDWLTCLHCGRLLADSPGVWGKHRKYCDARCSAKYYEAQRTARRQAKAALAAPPDFRPKPPETPHKPRTRLSPEQRKARDARIAANIAAALAREEAKAKAERRHTITDPWAGWQSSLLRPSR